MNDDAAATGVAVLGVLALVVGVLVEFGVGWALIAAGVALMWVGFMSHEAAVRRAEHPAGAS